MPSRPTANKDLVSYSLTSYRKPSDSSHRRSPQAEIQWGVDAEYDSRSRTLKEQCIDRRRFDTIQHAVRAFGARISFCKHRRSHQAPGMKTPPRHPSQRLDLSRFRRVDTQRPGGFALTEPLMEVCPDRCEGDRGCLPIGIAIETVTLPIAVVARARQHRRALVATAARCFRLAAAGSRLRHSRSSRRSLPCGAVSAGEVSAPDPGALTHPRRLTAPSRCSDPGCWRSTLPHRPGSRPRCTGWPHR